jgi:hypothetical protein
MLASFWDAWENRLMALSAAEPPVAGEQQAPPIALRATPRPIDAALELGANPFN